MFHIPKDFKVKTMNVFIYERPISFRIGFQKIKRNFEC